MKVKQNNKNKLAEYLKEATGVDVNPCSLFDIQVVSIVNALDVLFHIFTHLSQLTM